MDRVLKPVGKIRFGKVGSVSAWAILKKSQECQPECAHESILIKIQGRLSTIDCHGDDTEYLTLFTHAKFWYHPSKSSKPTISPRIAFNIRVHDLSTIFPNNVHYSWLLSHNFRLAALGHTWSKIQNAKECKYYT